MAATTIRCSTSSPSGLSMKRTKAGGAPEACAQATQWRTVDSGMPRCSANCKKLRPLASAPRRPSKSSTSARRPSVVGDHFVSRSISHTCSTGSTPWLFVSNRTIADRAVPILEFSLHCEGGVSMHAMPLGRSGGGRGSRNDDQGLAFSQEIERGLFSGVRVLFFWRGNQRCGARAL